MEQFELKNPILINGEECKALAYDTSKLTVEQYIDATAKGGLASNKIMEVNAHLHFLLGAYAIVNASENVIDISDVERVSGKDIVNITQIGRNMFHSDGTVQISEDTITFSQPLKFKGGAKKKLKYDFDSITTEQFNSAYDSGGFATNKVMELNDAFHLFLGIYAIINANTNIKFDELKGQLTGKNLLAVVTLGRNFFS